MRSGIGMGILFVRIKSNISDSILNLTRSAASSPRDPIEEQGGLNLYAFVGNCPFISEIIGLISTQDLWELISSPKLNKYYPLRRQAFEVGDFAVSVYGGIKQVCCDKAGMANK